MKNIKIFLLLITLYSSCDCPQKKLYNLEMKLIDGSWINASYNLEPEGYFKIGYNSGGYELIYVESCGLFPEVVNIRGAVIDFKIISIE